VKGDHFIIRQASPSLTIGGGVVIDPLPRRRHRRFRDATLKRLEMLADGTPEELLIETLDRLGPTQIRHLSGQTPLAEADLVTALQSAFKRQQVFTIPQTETPPELPNLRTAKTVVASRAGWSNLLAQFNGVLARYHQDNPLRVGMPRSELQSRLKLETGLFNKVIEQAQQEQVLQAVEATVWQAGHSPTFTPAQQQAMDSLLAQFQRQPFATPSFKESLAHLNHNEALLLALIETGHLLRLSVDVLVLPQTYQDFAAWIKAFLTAHGTITVAQVRDQFQTSRKYALALLEYTDSTGLTRRVGDERVLR
jgi:selenocysteine-specific elongation factor